MRDGYEIRISPARCRTLAAAALVVLVFAAVNLQAQVSGIKSEFLKDQQVTRIETDPLYFGNEPDHLIALQLVGRYQGQELTSQPTVEIRIMSFSKTPLYKKDKDWALSILANDAELPLGTPAITTYGGDTVGSVDTFTSADSAVQSIQLRIPQGALIKAAGTMKGTIMELMTYSPKVDAFLKSAHAARMNFRLGTSTFSPNDRQLNIIHRFVDLLTPKIPN
jgi:hypothetical protein